MRRDKQSIYERGDSAVAITDGEGSEFSSSGLSLTAKAAHEGDSKGSEAAEISAVELTHRPGDSSCERWTDEHRASSQPIDRI